MDISGNSNGLMVELILKSWSKLIWFTNISVNSLLFTSPTVLSPTPNSVDGFTAFINSSNFFRNRFGYPTLYAFSLQLPTDFTTTIVKPFDQTINYSTTVFQENSTFWNGKEAIYLFPPNTDAILNLINYEMLNNYITNFTTQDDKTKNNSKHTS